MNPVNEGRPTPASRGAGLHKINATAKQPDLDTHPTAVPVAWWTRASTRSGLSWCPLGCGELHQNVVPLDTAGPVLRTSRCGRGSYLLALPDVVTVTA